MAGPAFDADVLDGLARWAVERARPLRVDLVAGAEDLAQVQRLRHRAVADAGWADVTGEDGLERDEYDDQALHVAAWDGGGVVGTVRVVLPSKARPLPTERAFGIVVEPAGQVSDWGRLVVAPEHRDAGHELMLALLGRAWLAARAHGCVACVGVATEAVLDLYRSLGVEATVLAGPRLHWGEQRYAARLLGLAPDAADRMGLAAPPGPAGPTAPAP